MKKVGVVYYELNDADTTAKQPKLKDWLETLHACLCIVVTFQPLCQERPREARESKDHKHQPFLSQPQDHRLSDDIIPLVTSPRTIVPRNKTMPPEAYNMERLAHEPPVHAYAPRYQGMCPLGHQEVIFFRTM